VLYTTLKFVHILMAIIAVGFNATYGVLLARAGREPQHLSHTLRTVKVLDDRFANPGYGLLLVTGIAMVLLSDLSFTTLWILLALILYGLVAVLGIAAYSPTLRRQIAYLETGGPDAPEFRRLAKRGTALGMLLAVLVVAIVALMVFKPTL
jgi:uncharacterized membrane protein